MVFTKSFEVALIVFVGLGVLYTNSLPISDRSDSVSDSSNDDASELGSGLEPTRMPQRNRTRELYVVKAVVYEIGILTDSSDEDNDTSIESQERIDLTFYDAHRNDSHINFGRVPLPIQTNISGQILTGIAPVDLGAFSSPAELLQSLPITGTIVNITHSDTSYFQLKASNLTEDEKPRKLIGSDLESLPDLPERLLDLSLQSQNDVQPGDNLISQVAE